MVLGYLHLSCHLSSPSPTFLQGGAGSLAYERLAEPIKSSLFYRRGLIESARLPSLGLLSLYFLFISWHCSRPTHLSLFPLAFIPPLLPCKAKRGFGPTSNQCSSPSLSLCLVHDYIPAPETMFRQLSLSLTPPCHYQPLSPHLPLCITPSFTPFISVIMHPTSYLLPSLFPFPSSTTSSSLVLFLSMS